MTLIVIIISQGEKNTTKYKTEELMVTARSYFTLQEQYEQLKEQYEQLKEQCEQLKEQCEQLKAINSALKKKYSKYDKIINAEAHAQRIISEAQQKSNTLIAQAKTALAQATAALQQAQSNAEKIIQQAHQNARDIAGNALDAKENALLYERTAKSMKNIVLGYGNDYLIPSHTLFDDLAETYGYEQAAKDYKAVREKVRNMVMNNQAAACDYSDTTRRQNAIAFIIDAFNGKVETILARAKHDNFGTLRQKLTDAFNLVNYNGVAFKNARILDAYFRLSIDELRLTCILAEIRRRNAEEQLNS